MAYLQDRENQAIYCDAHVVEIQRRFHDVGDCRCIFVVRYDEECTVVSLQEIVIFVLSSLPFGAYADSPFCMCYYQEKVHLGRICIRPAGCDWSANSDTNMDANANADTDTQQDMYVDEKLKLSFLY